MRKPAALLVVTLACCGSIDAQAPKLKAEQWREDLRYFAREMPQRHKNLYHATTKEQFDRAVADLDAQIPTLQPHQIVVKLHQIAATVGDGHTGVHFPPYFKHYPIALFWFGKELRVVAAAKEYERALGTRLVKIGALPLDEVQARAVTCMPSAENENEWLVLSTSPMMIATPEILHTLGVVPDLAHASFTFETDEGQQFSLDLAAIEMPLVNGVPTLKLNPAAKTEPLFRQKPADRFWFTWLEEPKTVYVNFRGYDGLGDNAKEMFEFVDDHPTQKLVIDLRQNGGGDFFKGRKHLIEPLKSRPALNQKGHLFVVIGRRTFSAAMVNAIDFRKETRAILVGEPIGERPNSYSENDEMTLPNSRLVVSYSTRYYQFLDQDVPAVLPDKLIEPSWPEFKAGRDPVMEWVLLASE
ncbi:MAG TPA: hypothetical protein VJS92_03685 [Candidatus Polarisedimenticolaceae bacterium]|nr:hypothetical protein [Candidatus Polarisedimenticolaceae bacterium]